MIVVCLDPALCFLVYVGSEEDCVVANVHDDLV
jgi:hypothetical protein